MNLKIKYSLLVFAAYLSGVTCYAQYPVQQNLPNPGTLVTMPKPLGVLIFNFPDTCTATKALVSKYSGVVISTNKRCIWIRGANSWIYIPTDSTKSCSDCKCLPSVVFDSVNVLLSRFRVWDAVNAFQDRNNDFVVNPVEGRLSDRSIQFFKSFLAFFYPVPMSHQNLRFNLWDADFGATIKYPLLNRVPGYKFKRLDQFVFFKSVSQFSDQLTGRYNIRGQFVGIRENILNNDNNLLRATEAHNSLVHLSGYFIKTNAYRAAT